MRDIKSVGLRDFKEKKSSDVLSSISNNVMINNLIDDLINYNGVTNFFCDNDNYAFKNDKGEYVYIFINEDNVYVKNNFDGNNHELNYHLNGDGSADVNITIYSKVDYPNYSENRTVERSIKYDSNGVLNSDKKTVTSYLSSDDVDMNNQVKNDVSENYRVTTTDFLSNGSLMRKKETMYFLNPDFVKCEYFKGVYKNDDEVDRLVIAKDVIPKFSPISEEEYENIINPSYQKVKLFA
jgi:hypothetical protein